MIFTKKCQVRAQQAAQRGASGLRLLEGEDRQCFTDLPKLLRLLAKNHKKRNTIGR